jgi:hypothetical protein
VPQGTNLRALGAGAAGVGAGAGAGGGGGGGGESLIEPLGAAEEA